MTDTQRNALPERWRKLHQRIQGTGHGKPSWIALEMTACIEALADEIIEARGAARIAALAKHYIEAELECLDSADAYDALVAACVATSAGREG